MPSQVGQYRAAVKCRRGSGWSWDFWLSTLLRIQIGTNRFKEVNQSL